MMPTAGADYSDGKEATGTEHSARSFRGEFTRSDTGQAAISAAGPKGKKPAKAAPAAPKPAAPAQGGLRMPGVRPKG